MVTARALPPDSILHRQQNFRFDYVDTHERSFKTLVRPSVNLAVKYFFFAIPKPFLWLLQIRESIARRLGLKTANGRFTTLREIGAFSGRVGERIALFEVWDRNENELVTGQCDKHLHFILSFCLQSNEDQHSLRLVTAVQINNNLGKGYWLLVKPAHKLLMPVLVKQLSKRLSEKTEAFK